MSFKPFYIASKTFSIFLEKGIDFSFKRCYHIQRCRENASHKKLWKKFKKSVDKVFEAMYNKQARSKKRSDWTLKIK